MQIRDACGIGFAESLIQRTISRRSRRAHLKVIRNSSGRLRPSYLESQNGARSRIDALTIRMIENAKAVEFMSASANSDHEST